MFPYLQHKMNGFAPVKQALPRLTIDQVADKLDISKDRLKYVLRIHPRIKTRLVLPPKDGNKRPHSLSFASEAPEVLRKYVDETYPVKRKDAKVSKSVVEQAAIVTTPTPMDIAKFLFSNGEDMAGMKVIKEFVLKG